MRPLAKACGRAALAALALVAAGCGDPGDRAPGTRGMDARASQGADNPFVAAGWKAGDEASWERHMRERTTRQNEYARVAP